MNPYAGPLHVTVRTYRTDDAGVIVVEDNGPGFDPASDSEPPAAPENIRQRLKLMCGGKMEIKPREAGGTTVRMTIPTEIKKKDNSASDM